MNRAPVLFVFAALGLGAGAAELLRPPPVVPAVLLLIGLLLLLPALRARRGVAVLSLACLALAAALSSASHSGPPPVQLACDDASQLWRGRVASAVAHAAGASTAATVQQAELELEAQRCGDRWVGRAGRVRVKLRPGPEVRRGDRLELKLAVSPVPLPRNPWDPEPAALARRRGLSGRARVRFEHAVVERPGGLPAHLDRLRSAAAARIEGALPPRRAAIARALALGDRGGILPEQRELWARAGVAHLLAVSGLHVGLVAALVFLLLRVGVGLLPGAGERFSIRRAAAAATIPVVIAFCLWTGAAASAVRASVMAVAFLAGLATGRPSSAANALGAAGALLLLADPASLYDPGFVLSFAAVAALLAVPALPPARRRWQVVVCLLAGTAVASLVATLATAPLSAYLFGQVSIVAPVTNLVAVPLGGMVATPLALAFVVLAPAAAWVEGALAWLLDALLALLDGVAVTVGSWRFAAVDVPEPTALEIVAWVTLLVGVAALARRRRPLVVMAAAVLVLLGSVAWRVAERGGDGSLTVIYPYVGQGDAGLVLLPEGGVLLVDAGGALEGGAWDPGREVVAPLLRRHSIHTIDLAVLTHPHPDHLGGFAYVAQRFRIRELWMTGAGEELEEVRALRQLVEDSGGLVRTAEDLPVTATLEGVQLELLHPWGEALGSQRGGLGLDPALGTNDNSLVMRLQLEERSILLPGDIEREAEALVSGRLVATDILKVAHHGSRSSTSAALLDAARPRLAVISCGEDNRFGFPDPDVVARLGRYGAEIVRTDLAGMVTLRTDGRHWEVRTGRGGRLLWP